MTNLNTVVATKVSQEDDTTSQYPQVSFTHTVSGVMCMTKIYSYDVDNNKLNKDSSGSPSPIDGMFHRIDDISLDDLFDKFSAFTEKDALIHGVIKNHEEMGICIKGHPKPGCMSRTKDNFSYPDNALMLFDHDPSDRGIKISSISEFMSILESTDLQLKNCAYVSKSSASSGIRLKGKGGPLKGGAGVHLYMVIPGEQLKPYADILFKKLILKGHGHISISKNGRKYVRTIFDAAVHSPERLDFVAPAIVEPPLTIDQVKHKPRPGSAIDGTLLAELTPEEDVEYKKICDKLLNDAECAAFKVRLEYAKEQSKITDIPTTKLVEYYNMGDKSEIDFDHPLTNDDGTPFRFSDVIANPDDYKNLSMRDPFDPADGPSKAQLYINDNGTIVLNSFAHGGTVYKMYQNGELYTGKTLTFKQPLLGSLPLDEFGNVSRLINQYGDIIRYPNGREDYNTKSWLIYDGKGWRSNTDSSMERLALTTVESIKKENPGIHGENALTSFVKKSRKVNHIKKILEAASWKEEIQFNGADVDNDPMLIGTLNGVVDLETGEIIQNSQEYLITKRVNASFDEGAECPNWDRFLNRITGEDQEMIEYLNLLTSYFLTGKTNEHALFIIHGPGANGKTTWVECIQAIMGEYASQMPVESLSYTKSNAIDDNLARTRGSRLTVTSEIKKGARLNEPLIKQLTGGERVTARQMFKGSTEYKPTAKFVMVVNDLPEITGSDAAMARRMQVIPFTQVIQPNEEDKFFADKLKGEYDAIFTRAVKMCPEWIKFGLIAPQKIVDASADYVESKDSFGLWKKEYLSDDACIKDFTSSQDLNDSLEAWNCESSVGVLDTNTFYSSLKDVEGVVNCRKTVDGKQVRGYSGVKLAT
jgi:P4 family phage/plasmid primase-like protien